MRYPGRGSKVETATEVGRMGILTTKAIWSRCAISFMSTEVGRMVIPTTEAIWSRCAISFMLTEVGRMVVPTTEAIWSRCSKGFMHLRVGIVPTRLNLAYGSVVKKEPTDIKPFGKSGKEQNSSCNGAGNILKEETVEEEHTEIKSPILGSGYDLADEQENPEENQKINTTNFAGLKTETLNTEDDIVIIYEDVKPDISGEFFCESRSYSNSTNDILMEATKMEPRSYELSKDSGTEPQQNIISEQDEMTAKRDKNTRNKWSKDFIVKANDTEYRRNRHMLKPMRMPSLDDNAASKIKTSITDLLNTVVPSVHMEMQGDSSGGSRKDIPIQGDSSLV
ncbi:hypothetical protein JTB14_027163 [Gonioctena quinquepunctata]|nr:hypothetical protein JTB14_027163 [Gonioctena quinquepunctata]